MKLAKITVMLDDKEMYELDRILIDEDQGDAFEFLRSIKKKVKAAQDRTCGITSEKASATD
ncbi:MAG: hypothetical protein HW414_1640 [Dehalococcoidia bacterium]|nr:hypothetical protein [Dehalococcoidia bacterium]